MAATAAAGLLLMLLANGLRHRKRQAYRLSLGVLAATAAVQFAKGVDLVQAGAVLFELGLFVWARRSFCARGDNSTRWRALRAFAFIGSASVGLGVAALNLPWAHLAGQYSIASQLQHVTYGLVGFNGPLRFAPTQAGTRAAEAIGDSLIGLGVLMVLVPAYLLLRSARPPARADNGPRLRQLLDGHGRVDSLGYFALRRDKDVIWSPSGKAAIAYRVVGGVMLASGDPLGDPEAWPGAVEPFLASARSHAWVPAVMSCSERAGAVWARYGLRVLEIGDEAIVDVSGFSLAGREMRNVRQMVNRVERSGYRCQVRRIKDIPRAELEQLAEESDAWRGAPTERGFSMALGRIGGPGDTECVVVTAERDGRLRAFLHFAPWGYDGLSLDLMRRDRTADPGLNELLIVTTLRAAPQLGITRVSLNFAMFRAALQRGESLGAGPALRGWRAFLIFVSRWYQIESLYRFNAKFRPVWSPRYVCYPTTRDLPTVALAAARAEAFITRPHLRRRRTPEPAP